MMRISGTLRTYPAGAAAAAGITVTLKLESDDSTVTSTTTDADGRFVFSVNGHPGPWYWVATDTVPAVDVTRSQSALSYGSGGAYGLYELVYPLRVMGNGVISGYGSTLTTTYDGAGLDLDIGTGATIIKGIPVSWPAVTDLTLVSTRDATNPKQCYLVAETVGAGEATEGKTRLLDVCGTAGASPSLPSLTQTEALYQLPLYTFRLPSVASGTTLTQLTDVRTYAGAVSPLVSSIVRRSDPTSELTNNSTIGASATGMTTTLTLLSGVTYTVTARAFLNTKSGLSANTAQMAIFLNGVSNMSTYQTTSSTSYTGLHNSHLLAGVVGTGSTIDCGMRIKVSAGTMTYNTGYLLVEAKSVS